MLWFTIWSLLVVGTLVGWFFLLREVYRAALRLLAELERLSEVLDRLTERTEAFAGAGTVPVPPDLLDPASARARLAEARLATLRRRARRTERHAEAYRRWQAYVR